MKKFKSDPSPSFGWACPSSVLACLYSFLCLWPLEICLIQPISYCLIHFDKIFSYCLLYGFAFFHIPIRTNGLSMPTVTNKLLNAFWKMQCLIPGLFPTYFLHMEQSSGRKVFLLAGRKRKKCSSSTYVISSDPTDLSKGADSAIATLRFDKLIL